MSNPTSASQGRKKTITIRLDADVIEWFKATGRGYQTRINRELRQVISTRYGKPSGSSPKPVYENFQDSLGR